ncbi:class I mannose-6-phosphate isomerase [Oceanobacillus sojae]|uniref:class I mannose-6-phosphate isomerase n=1 Tax=Oceanobacillus sojae TaxID=582851 RepID=UPI0021A3CB41|nr:class I mannose-6-phosphate isomerase [Oceanobacillus sojae]MCT1901954.1 class I mannose-6-phosphate isomerase [Oceanobacillus sojae]
MKKKLYYIEPVFESKLWGGNTLKKYFNYNTDLENIALVYHVIALPDHLDCNVKELNIPLSEFYKRYKDELFKCDREALPVRSDSSNAVDKLSIQLHPNDEYGLKHDNMFGKVESTIVLTHDEDGKKLMGHHAETREEFKQLVEKKDWDKLFRIVDYKKGQFTHLPTGTLHGSLEVPENKESIHFTFETNSDLTYRLYDFDRNDPDRPLHVEKIIDTVNIPDNAINPLNPVTESREGYQLIKYVDEKGIFTSFQLEVASEGIYNMNEFMFLTCVHGEGRINDYDIKLGETIFVPAEFGELRLSGNMSLCGISYKD